MQLDIIKNAKRNIAFGFINKLIIMLCPFIARTAIQYLLNAQYLGLSSLFNSILAVLSLAEMGFSSAVVYHMYKPAAEGDIKAVNALLKFFRKAYRCIGTIIGIVGIAIIPVLPKLISGTYPQDVNLTTLYLIFLFNTCISYFLFGYLSSIIVVNQRDDINSVCNMITKLGLTALQIIALATTHDFYLFALLMPVFTIINNLWVAWRVRKLFPQYKCEGTLNKDILNDLKKLVIGTFIQKICATTRNSIDSICVSVFLGLTATAIYANYFYIMDAITQMLGIVITSFMGGVGNHVASKSVDDNFLEMKRIDFAYLWISGWSAICLLCMYQPFMELWMGREMLLPMPSVALFCTYYYVLKLGDMRSMYSSANGLWWVNRWRAICETVLNVALNILLGKFFGVNGIILATLISLISCNYLWAARITFKYYFGMDKIKEFYGYQLKQTAVMLAACLFSFAICIAIPIENLVIVLLIRAGICLTVPNAIMFLIYKNNECFKYAIKKIMKKQ